MGRAGRNPRAISSKLYLSFVHDHAWCTLMGLCTHPRPDGQSLFSGSLAGSQECAGPNTWAGPWCSTHLHLYWKGQPVSPQGDPAPGVSTPGSLASAPPTWAWGTRVGRCSNCCPGRMGMLADPMSLGMRVWLLGCDALDPWRILLGLMSFPREVVTSSPCPADSSTADGVPCGTMGAA